MISEISSRQVYLACGSTDLRKSIDGLAVMVKEAFKLDPFSPNLFVFCNKKRDKIKILQWDHNGFWLHYRRLERGRFNRLAANTDVVNISHRRLRWLLDGLSPKQNQAYRAVKQRLILQQKSGPNTRYTGILLV